LAALNTSAQRARLDAQHLRAQAQVLKLRVRRNVARSRERLGQAQVETDRARAKRVEPLPSPWSELRWAQSYDTLDRTLVPLP
jgi:hypothetical protein